MNVDSDTMINLRGQVCGRAAPKTYFSTFHGNDLTRNSAPKFITTDVEGVDFISGHVDSDGVLLCSYDRAVDPPPASKDIMYGMTQKLYAILAYGSMSTPSRPGYHGYNKYFVSDAKLDFLKQYESISTSARKVETKEWVRERLLFFATLTRKK